MAKVSLRAYNREIEAMIDRNHLDEAIAHCQHILKTFPKHLETYRLLGKAYLEARRHDEAVDIFSRVLVAEPSDFVSQVGMSIIRDEQDKLDDAIWHMERAFEAQPSNAAIQGELQRLYGRRDGVTPPRIRMTRGALAHMYMQGELYPQAISETRGVLEEDKGRSDMQVLLAKAYYKSGQKNDAADAASSVLKRYPYCFDANRVLAEILGSDRPESAQVYRKRVIELDPYAAQVSGSIFQSSEVGDAAVAIEHLDWNGQPAGMPSGWGTTGAISLDGGIRETQPDWLKSASTEMTVPPPSAPAFASDKEALSTHEPSSPAQPADDIPDFLRAAGWGESTGAFDESTSPAVFDDEPASPAQPLEQGDLPDWVKAMAPQEAEQTKPEEEDIPDWINKIGTGELPVPSVESDSADQPDWLGGIGDTQSQTTDDQPDWIKNFLQGDQAPSTAPSGEQPVWVSGLEQEEQSSGIGSDEQPDWLQGIGREERSVSAESGQDDWLRQLGSEAEPEKAFDDMSLIAQQGEEQEKPIVQPQTNIDTGELGKSEQEQDDSFAWLENLAAKQGATEGLLTKPEERLEQEPDWVKQAKTVGGTTQPAAKAEELGKSEQEQDDSFAWLENLAAKQGATEGLLTKPEERLEQEPEWIQQAKTVGATTQPPAKAEELGKSEQEQDDSFAWLENLAAKQGATEGLLTQPEKRLEQEPEWVRQAKEWAEQEPAAPVARDESVPADDVSSWLKGLDEEEEQKEPVPAVGDDTASWLMSLNEPEETPITSSTETEDLPTWMRGVEEEKVPETEPVVPAMEETAPSSDLPEWLSDLEKEESEAPAVPASEGLPAWMRDDTGEAVAEPTKIEPTRPTDWTPVESKKVEAEAKPEPKPEPKPVVAPKPEPSPAVAQEKPAPKPKKPAPKKEKIKPAAPPEPYKEPVTRRGTGMLTMPVDPVLGSARAELSRSNIPGALETYEKLIKKGRFLEEVIFDLREALYRYPVEVSIWQTLGDAYMRANQLQDALDAYTKAEELLR